MSTKPVKLAMPRYPNSNIYPISETAIGSIAANMKENGFDSDFPILIKDGGIVDGYHRYQAALKAEVEPIFREFDGTDEDVLRFILRVNGDRRHLNEGQKAAAAVIINRRLGKDAKSIVSVAKNNGVNEATVNRLTSYSDDDLQSIVNGTKTQNEVKEKKAKASQKNPTYTLTKNQAAKLAALVVSLDERGKKLLARAFDLGLKVLEEQSATAGN